VTLAKALLPDEQLKNPAIYPPASVKLSVITPGGEKLQKWQAAFDRIVKG